MEMGDGNLQAESPNKDCYVILLSNIERENIDLRTHLEAFTSLIALPALGHSILYAHPLLGKISTQPHTLIIHASLSC